VSRLLRYADLPAIVVEVFGRPVHIQEDWAVELAKQCRDDQAKRLLIQRARQLKLQRVESPQAIYAHLSGMYRNRGRRLAAFREQIVKDADGRQLFRASFRSRSVHLIFQRDALTNDDLRGVVQGVTDILVGRDARPDLRAAQEPTNGDPPLHGPDSRVGETDVSSATDETHEVPRSLCAVAARLTARRESHTLGYKTFVSRRHMVKNGETR
jgi:hypothetical protein